MKLNYVKSHILKDSLVVPLPQELMLANDGKPLEFEAKIEKNRLVLSANLESLDRTREVDTDEN